jgi:hypothetical protein
VELIDMTKQSRMAARGGKASPPAEAEDELPPPSQPAFDEAEIIAKLTSPLLGPQRRPYALIIDEATLDAALGHPRCRAYLLYVAVNCAAVICCRARPDQKARVVKLIRDGVPHSRTLAVGDGANDVDMIRQAHVGVGIAGAEGVQAANASDYSIGRFRFLQRLLLVHGRWNYHRMARLVLYTFYKNLVFVAVQFWYSTITGFSGQKFYVEYGNQTFNLLYTSLPLLMFGIYDKDVWADTALRYPKLYDMGRLNKVLNVRVFVSWLFAAISESLMIFFFIMKGYATPDAPQYIKHHAPHWHGPGGAPPGTPGPDIGLPSGTSPFVFQLGTVAFSCVLAIVSMRAAVEMHTHHWWFQFFTFGSAIIWIPCMWLFDVMDNDGMEGGAIQVFGSAAFWLTLFLTLFVATVRTVAWKAWKRFYRPDLRHVVQEAQSITRDYTSVNTFTEAADIARRTGKTVEEVYRAANITQAAVAVIAARKSEAAAAAAAVAAAGGLGGAAGARPASGKGAGAGAAAEGSLAGTAGKGGFGTVTSPSSIAASSVKSPEGVAAEAAAATAAPDSARGRPRDAGAGVGGLGSATAAASHGHMASRGHYVTPPASFDPRLLERTLVPHHHPPVGSLPAGSSLPGARGVAESSEFDVEDAEEVAAAVRGHADRLVLGSGGSASARGAAAPSIAVMSPEGGSGAGQLGALTAPARGQPPSALAAGPAHMPTSLRGGAAFPVLSTSRSEGAAARQLAATPYGAGGEAAGGGLQPHSLGVRAASASATTSTSPFASGGVGSGRPSGSAPSTRARIDSSAIFEDMQAQGLRLPRELVGAVPRPSSAAMKRRLFDSASAAITSGSMTALPRNWRSAGRHRPADGGLGVVAEGGGGGQGRHAAPAGYSSLATPSAGYYIPPSVHSSVNSSRGGSPGAGGPQSETDRAVSEAFERLSRARHATSAAASTGGLPAAAGAPALRPQRSFSVDRATSGRPGGRLSAGGEALEGAAASARGRESDAGRETTGAGPGKLSRRGISLVANAAASITRRAAAGSGGEEGLHGGMELPTVRSPLLEADHTALAMGRAAPAAAPFATPAAAPPRGSGRRTASANDGVLGSYTAAAAASAGQQMSRHGAEESVRVSVGGGGAGSAHAPSGGSHRTSSFAASALHLVSEAAAGVAAELTGVHQAQPLRPAPSLDALDRLSLETQRTLIARSRSRLPSQQGAAAAAGMGAGLAELDGSDEGVAADGGGVAASRALLGSGTASVSAAAATSRSTSASVSRRASSHHHPSHSDPAALRAGASGMDADPAPSEFFAGHYATFPAGPLSAPSAAPASAGAAEFAVGGGRGGAGVGVQGPRSSSGAAAARGARPSAGRSASALARSGAPYQESPDLSEDDTDLDG